ncbi:hypothetical protein JCM12296A_03790 [Desulfosarcina cetonica]
MRGLSISSAHPGNQGHSLPAGDVIRTFAKKSASIASDPATGKGQGIFFRRTTYGVAIDFYS